MSHRIWWAIAFCALGIGLAIEADAPADEAAMAPSAATTTMPAPVAATPSANPRRHS